MYTRYTTSPTQVRLLIKIFFANKSTDYIPQFFFALAIVIVQNFKAHSQTDQVFFCSLTLLFCLTNILSLFFPSWSHLWPYQPFYQGFLESHIKFIAI